MNNLSYMKKKITFYGDVAKNSIEDIAKIYLEGIGFDVYFCLGYQSWSPLFIKYKSDSFEKLFSVLSDDKNGIPDLVLIKDENITFVEVKSINDVLRGNQLEWIDKHPQYKVIVLYLEIEDKSNEPPIIKGLYDKIDELNREIINLKEEKSKLIEDITNKLKDISESFKHE